MAVGREEKPEISRYLLENPMVGGFKSQRTFSGWLFVIPERLGSIRAVFFPFLQSAL